MKRITACATGRVQGVGYRYFVTDIAREYGVSGYVRNRGNGSVEVVAEGTEPALQEFIGQLRALRDPIIRVQDLHVTWGESTGEFRAFGIRW